MAFSPLRLMMKLFAVALVALKLVVSDKSSFALLLVPLTAIAHRAVNCALSRVPGKNNAHLADRLIFI